jgi:uncharacterized cupin superfamily protein
MPAGTDGAPPHFHSGAAELFYVLDVLLGEELLTLATNDLLVVPAGTPHAFAPAKNQSADVLFVYTPSKPRFDYYRLLERVYTGQVGSRKARSSEWLVSVAQHGGVHGFPVPSGPLARG